MRAKHRRARSRARYANKRRRPKRGRKIGASAARPAREVIGAAMNKMKGTPRALKKFSLNRANGAHNKNSATDKAAATPILQPSKTEIEAAIQRYVDLFDFAPIGYVTFDRIGRIEDINL